MNGPGIGDRGAGHGISPHREWAAAGVLLLLLVAAGSLMWRAVEPRNGQHHDTRLRSGYHLVFVVIAPTQLGAGQRSYVAAIQRARGAMRKFAASQGYYFSTVGISDDFSTRRGLEVLAELGPFDELVVGRNWLNSGVDKYVTARGASAAVPQLLVLVQRIRIGRDPVVSYGDSREMLRLIGTRPVEAWAKENYPITARLAESEAP